MSIEKGRISEMGLGMLVACLIMGSILLTAFTHGVTGHYTWIVVLTGYAASFPFILAYIRLAEKFKTKNLIQINDIIYGRYIGKIVSALYIWYFIEITTLSLYGMGTFIMGFMMYETPVLVLNIVFMLVCAWAVRGGIEVITRCCFIILSATLIEVILLTLLLIKDMDYSNILPLFDLPALKYIQGTNIMFAIPYCELIVFTMGLASVKRDSKIGRPVLIGFAVGAATLLVVVARNTAVLGELTSIVASQSFKAGAIIDLGEIFTRMEILTASTLLITIFIKICVFYYASVLGVAQIFKLKTYIHIVMPLGVLIVTYTAFIYTSPVEETFYGANTHWAYVIPHQIVLPLLSLVVAKIRKLPKDEGE